MPGSMDGVRLAHAVRNRWPPIHIVATSAHAIRADELPTGSIFLPKPYDPTRIADRLHALAAGIL